MNSLIAFDLAFHGEHRDKQDERFSILKSAAARAVAFWFRKSGDVQKVAEFILNLLNPRRVQFGNGGKRFSVHAS